MAEPWIVADQLSGAWRPASGQFRAVGWTSGPAGAAVVDLSPGVRVALDAARPHQLSEALVEAPDGHPAAGDVAFVHALFGDEVADRLFALSDGADDRLRPISSDLLLARHPRAPVSTPRQEALMRFVLAADLAEDAAISGEIATLAGLEAATIAMTLAEEGFVDASFASTLARQHAHALAGHDQRTMVAIAARSDSNVELLRRARELIGDDDPSWPSIDRMIHDTISRTMARRGMQQLAEDGVADAIAFLEADKAGIPDTGDERVALAAAPAAAALAAAAGDRRRTTEPAEEPVAVESAAHAMAWLSEGGAHLRVVARSSSARDGEWARAFDRRGPLLLGLSPLQAEGGGATALVLLPPGSRAGDLVVDITGEPGAPRPSPSRVQITRAITTGRRAARLERLGRDAVDAWLDCSAAWRAAGDPQRARLADNYASGGRRMRSGDVTQRAPRPLVADELIEY